MGLVVAIVATGVGATASIDLWALLRARVFGVPAPNYGLVGRWLAHMPQGRFRHEAIAAAATVPGEGLLGWGAHYAIGIGYAALLPLFAGAGWFAQPRLLPALALGIGTVLAPFVLMQPGMGAGWFASRTPRPWHARFHSFVMHALFGFGLYASALLTSNWRN
jgi:hypothetical protein